MKIEIAQPPMMAEIQAVFPEATKPGVIFAWGDTIYNPSGGEIPPPLLAHEAMHGCRQTWRDGATESIENWWRKYLIDPEFRYNEELKAHVAELKAQWPRDRNKRAQLFMSTAKRLTAPLYAYGSKAPTLTQALSHLRYEVEHVR